ncbi:MAG: DUF3847 domain-containing protein [Lachnospiraceae bacterium]|nr:DUF3847 domain-containing protein [Lachnospiraceae bacterium]
MAKKHSVLEDLRTAKELIELREEKKKAERKCVQAHHNLTKAENMLQSERQAERRKRNHRLITRGAQFEYMFPESKELTEDQFMELCNALFAADEVRDHVRRLILTLKDGD